MSIGTTALPALQQSLLLPAQGIWFPLFSNLGKFPSGTTFSLLRKVNFPPPWTYFLNFFNTQTRDSDPISGVILERFNDIQDNIWITDFSRLLWVEKVLFSNEYCFSINVVLKRHFLPSLFFQKHLRFASGSGSTKLWTNFTFHTIFNLQNVYGSLPSLLLHF